jgi:hypothetical protein
VHEQEARAPCNGYYFMPTKQHSPLYTTGLCKDTLLVGGVFDLQDQSGFPIDCSFDLCKEKGLVIDWFEALCCCWVNDCLKFDSFLRQAESLQPEAKLGDRFRVAITLLFHYFPKMLQSKNPITTACRYVIAKKRLRANTLTQSGQRV